MRLFLSHTAADVAIARFLKSILQRDLALDIFMTPDDAPAGSEWIEVIRAAIESCDELLSLATPASVDRQWLAAEWACFWLKPKPCTPVLVGAPPEKLWEPMRAYEAVDLLEPRSAVSFLEQLAERTGTCPADGVHRLAAEIAREIPRIQERTARSSVEAVAKRLRAHIGTGSGNIDPDDVDFMVRTESVADLLDITRSPNAGQVKLKQVAVRLVELRQFDDALLVASSMRNRNEVSNVAQTLVRSMDASLGESSEEWRFLTAIHTYLGAPQRRDIETLMDRREVEPLGPWRGASDPGS